MEQAELDEKLYVILLANTPGQTRTFEHVQAHVQHLTELERDNRLVLCGPFADFPGGMVIIRADSLEEAQALAEQDPFVASGVSGYEVRTWQMSNTGNGHLGVLADAKA